MQIEEKNNVVSKKKLIYLIVLLLIFFNSSMLFIFLSFLMIMVYSMLLFKNRVIQRSTTVYISTIYAFLCWSLLSTFNGTNQIENLSTTILVFIPSIFLSVYINEKKEKDNFYYMINLTLMCFGIIISLYGILLWMFGSPQAIQGNHYQVLNVGPLQLKQLIFGMAPLYRITSVTSNPNSLSIWLQITIASTFFIYYFNGRTKKTLHFIIILIQLGALILTFSRSGYIIVSLIIVLWLLFFQKNVLKKICLSIIAFGFMLFAFVMYLNNYNTLNKRFKFDFNGRDEIWGYALQEIIKSPVMGIGFADSTPYLSNIYGTEIGIHNGFLTLALEIGVFPVLILFFIWLLIIIRLYKLYNLNTEKSKIIITSLLVYLILFIPQQLVEAKLFRFDVIHFLWLYILIYSLFYIKNFKNPGKRSLVK